MSHFSEIKTSLRNKEHLKKALEKLGYEIIEGEEPVSVRGFFGAVQPAEFKVATDSNYDIGFVLDASGNYQMVGDWELLPKVAGIEQEAFLSQVKREYARSSILEMAKAKGMEVQCNETDGTIEMVVTQW